MNSKMIFKHVGFEVSMGHADRDIPKSIRK